MDRQKWISGFVHIYEIRSLSGAVKVCKGEIVRKLSEIMRENWARVPYWLRKYLFALVMAPMLYFEPCTV